MAFAQEHQGKRLVVRSANYMYVGTFQGLETLDGEPTGPKYLVFKDPKKIFDIDEGKQEVLNDEVKPLPNPLLLAEGAVESIYPTSNTEL